MYSSVNNHDKSKSILSWRELLGIIVVFSFLLYLLFPKGNIEALLEEQGTNSNLSLNYLKSMILYHPNNIQLKMMLMEKYTQRGQEEKALEINHELMKQSNNKKLLSVLYKVDYLLRKSLYFKHPNPKKLEALKAKLLTYYAYTKEKRDYLFFFAESTNIDYSYLKYHSLKHFMKENPNEVDYELEKMAFDLANQLNYKKEAYLYLQELIKYPEITYKLIQYLINSLFEHREYKKAKEITIKLFLESKNDDELTKFFHLALYALVEDKSKNSIEISQLIQNYANLKKLTSTDIVLILKTLLKLGESKEAANFTINIMYTNPENFDEIGTDLALQSLLYHSKLQEARILSFFAQSKFKKQKYLDKAIQISTWLGEAEIVAALNEEGYQQYNGNQYEQYFLKNENLDFNYKVLGLIYKKKIQNKQYQYLDNLARYYDYTGEINEAEAYFSQIAKKSQKKKALYYAIEFSHKNSHFEKGLRLYAKYQLRYGQNPKLHELSIKKLLALKHFDEAYAMSKEQNAMKKQRLIDLAWLEKDYAFLYQKLWSFEEKKGLQQQGYEQLILLEMALNKGKKLDYLYQKSWKTTQRSYYFSTFMYKLLQKKDFKQFQKVLTNLNKNEKNILHKDINFQMILAEYHSKTKSIELALKNYEHIFKLKPNRVPSHQAYLWFLLDNQDKSPQLRQKLKKHLSYLKQHPNLQKQVGLVSIVTAMNLKQEKLANYWLAQLRAYDPNNKAYQSLAKEIARQKKEQLFVQYNKMQNNEYLENQITLKEKDLGTQLQVQEQGFSHQWKLYQNLKAKINLKHYAYKGANSDNQEQTAFDISLKNSEKRFLWEVNLGLINAKKNKLSSALNLSYDFHNVQVALKGKYQKKTELTPFLEQNSLENALALNVKTQLNRRTSFSFLLQKSQFQTFDNVDVGTAQNIQLSANYLLRLGYPNISFNAYVSQHSFSKNIAHDFSELGISTSIGTVRQNTLNSSWKPFGTLALAVNNEKNLGGSLSLGVSKTLKGNDSLDLSFDYYNGIGVISEPIYGVNVKYRF